VDTGIRLITGSWKIWLAGIAVSLGVFAVIYFTVIKPTTDHRERGRSKQLPAIPGCAQRPRENAPSAAAKRQLSQAERLTACLQDAGIDTDAVQDCQARYQP
jgi:hypothetical protein